MEKLNLFLKRNESTFSFLRYILGPLLLAAAFFLMDGRYLRKADWEISNQDNKELITKLSNEQKAAFNKLTDAITTLAVEQRNTVEYQRVNNSSINLLSSRLDKNESLNTTHFSKIDEKLGILEITQAKQDVVIKQNSENINRRLK
jgi:hypothetical protein